MQLAIFFTFPESQWTNILVRDGYLGIYYSRAISSKYLVFRYILLITIRAMSPYA